jgi:Ca-activated chloride channel family protein
MPSQATTNRSALLVALGGGLAFALVIVVLVQTCEGPGPSPGPGACVELVVSSSTEKSRLIADVAKAYNDAERIVDGRCATVVMDEAGFTSGKAAAALAAPDWSAWRDADGSGAAGPEPHVWLPTSSLWLGQVDRHRPGRVTNLTDPESLATSPLVLAMPKVLADELHRLKGPEIGWREIADLASQTEPWSPAHPEWGPFKLAKDHPRYSTSGLNALVATYYAAAGARSGTPDLTDASVSQFVHRIESSVARHHDDATVLMETLYRETEQGRGLDYLTALAVQEQMVDQYNRGAPAGRPIGDGPPDDQPLVAIPFRDGTVVSDHPYAILDTAGDAERAVAADFLDHLRSGEIQARFKDSGFRTGDDRPPNQIATPDAQWVQQLLDEWNSVRRKVRVLVAVDTSGTMADAIDPNASRRISRLQKLQDALKPALRLLPDGDEIEIWTFPGSQGDHDVTLPRSTMRDVRARLPQIIDDLKARGATTPLHRATCAAHQRMNEDRDPERIHAVVLLSDGLNDDPEQTSEETMLRCVQSEAREPLRIYTVTYGGTAGRDTMIRIAERTRALPSYDATDPQNLEKVLASVFTRL